MASALSLTGSEGMASTKDTSSYILIPFFLHKYLTWFDKDLIWVYDGGFFFLKNLWEVLDIVTLAMCHVFADNMYQAFDSIDRYLTGDT